MEGIPGRIADIELPQLLYQANVTRTLLRTWDEEQKFLEECVSHTGHWRELKRLAKRRIGND
jgi:hypothetical protein